MRVLHVVTSINRDVGGPALTVPALAEGLVAQGVEATIATLDYARHGPQGRAGGAHVVSMPAPAFTRALRGWSPQFERKVAGLAKHGADVVHGHGLWMFPNLYARRAAVAAGRPLVISPRGMLDDWSLRRGRLRKRAAWRLFEHDNIAAARLLHATSAAEEAAIRAAGCAQPVAVIPNGVEIPDPAKTPPRDVLERAWPELAGKEWLLFLSRLHPKKGVIELVRAWSGLEQRFPGWQLVIAGPELDGHGEEVRASAESHKIRGRITFPGMLSGDLKSAALAHAALLVLPTHAENFGVVVAEALAHGTPALTTRSAPWRELADENCGWWVEDREDSVGVALAGAMALSPEARKAMGARGRAMVAERYSWSRVAGEMHAVYRWLAGTGQRPGGVHTL
jgi:glycosyltransferase involved in cell wall biosynthesis